MLHLRDSITLRESISSENTNGYMCVKQFKIRKVVILHDYDLLMRLHTYVSFW